MPINSPRFIGGTTPGRKLRWFLRVLFLAVIVLAIALPGLSQGPGDHKIAPDFSSFPVNPDGTVDVIIQFTGEPQAKHFQIAGGQLKHRFQHINGAAYRIPVKMLAFLENHPDVAYVSPDRLNQSSDIGTEVYRAAVTATAAYSQYGSGLNGSGIGIAVIDSGVYQHDDLKTATGTGSRIVYSQSFVSGDSTVNDVYGHGTHVAGIIAGNGADSKTGYASSYQGIATNANIINLRVLDQNGAGTDSQVISAIERAIALQSTYNIRVINLSLGRPVYESYTQDPLCQEVEAAWQAGIVVVVAAGNNGRDNTYGEHGYGTIEAPGNDPAVITVGATNDKATAARTDDIVASYSSKGPTVLDHVVKPDLVAPGNQIPSLLSPNSTIATQYPSFVTAPPSGSSAEYLVLSGTSMATPVVSGAAALMLQENPSLTPDTVKARMMKTAWKGYPVNGWAYDFLGNGYFSQYDIFTIGAGYLDIDAALNSTDLANGSAFSPIVTFNSSTGQVTLVDGTSIVWGKTILWGSTIVWGNTIVWGSNVLNSTSVVWGAAAGIVWSDSTMVSGNTLVWGSSIVWGHGTYAPPTAMGNGDAGDK